MYSEEELIAALQAHNKDAFNYLYDNYSGALYGIIHKIVKSEEIAQDLLQETFVKIWKNISNYNSSKGRLFTWMLNIGRNAAIDILRSKQHKNEGKIQGLENSVDLVGDESHKPENFDHIGLDNVLVTLKPEQKVLIDMVYFQGYTHEEVSKELDIPLGTVKTRIRTAVIYLRKILT